MDFEELRNSRFICVHPVKGLDIWLNRMIPVICQRGQTPHHWHKAETDEKIAIFFLLKIHRSCWTRLLKRLWAIPCYFHTLGLWHLYLGIPWVNHLSFPARTALIQPPKLAGVLLLNSGSHGIDEWYVFLCPHQWLLGIDIVTGHIMCFIICFTFCERNFNVYKQAKSRKPAEGKLETMQF